MWKDQLKQPNGYRRRGKTNLSNPNRTPNATIRTYLLPQVEYIILHRSHIIPRVNKMNKNTEQFHNSIMTLYPKSKRQSPHYFSDEAKFVTTDVISALKNLEDKLAGIPGNVILHNHFYPNLQTNLWNIVLTLFSIF